MAGLISATTPMADSVEEPEHGPGGVIVSPALDGIDGLAQVRVWVSGPTDAAGRSAAVAARSAARSERPWDSFA